jgi:hypothetical protein
MSGLSAAFVSTTSGIEHAFEQLRAFLDGLASPGAISVRRCRGGEPRYEIATGSPEVTRVPMLR